MKKTRLVLASLTAIILLSCNSVENSSSSEEDLDFLRPQGLTQIFPVDEEQALVLKKASPDNIVQGSSGPGQSTINATGTKTVSCGSMSITKPYPQTGCSSSAICDFTSLPAGSKNVSYKFVSGGPTGQGAFTLYFLDIECGQYYLDIEPLSYANVTTTAFVGTSANVKCYVTFCGKCNGTASGGGPCTLSYTNMQGTQVYTY